jgi:hypothetical protein
MSRFVVPVAALCAVVCVSSSAFAQIIYEPVQYQYGSGQNVYYYGGSDPRVHYAAAQPITPGGTWGRVNGWNFASGDLNSHREVSTEPTRTFIDVPGFQYSNATFWGYGPDDARNDAYANSTRYFKKSDLLAAAVRMSDGTYHVSAQARPIQTISGGVAYIGPARGAMPKPLLIIPKDLLKKQPNESDKSFAINR